jgi:hypothetical protein
VVVKLPDGQRLDRRFPKTCHLQAVVDWVESAEPEIFDFTLVSKYPRRRRRPPPPHPSSPPRRLAASPPCRLSPRLGLAPGGAPA